MKKEERDIQSTRDWIVAKAILDRKFDIPEALYAEINDEVMILIMETPVSERKWFHNEFIHNEHFREFAKYVRENVRRKKDGVYKFLTGTGFVHQREILQLIFFRQSDWALYVRSMRREYMAMYVNAEMIRILEFLLCEKDFEFQIMSIYNTLKWYVSKQEVIRQLREDAYNKDYRINVDNVVEFAYMVNCNDSYADSMFCIDNGIPVLYKDYDISLLHMYLETVLECGYRGLLDSVLLNIGSLPVEDNSEKTNLSYFLWEIGDSLNQNNMIYYCIFTKEKFNTATMMDIMTDDNLRYNEYGWRMNAPGYIKNFKDIVLMHGHNKAGYSIELQVLFLQHNGDVTSMFDDNGKLLDEASIIKMADQLPRLMQLLSTNSLRFLLTNSPEFVKNIMTSTSLSMASYIAIARALLPVPIDEELWKVLNEYESTGLMEVTGGQMDYRVFLVTHIVSEISTDVLFNNVPEAMVYIEPSVLYITRNMSDETMLYAPVHRLVPYLRAYLERNDYKRLNLYCNGEYVSITTAVGGDIDFIVDLMIREERYGYICDIKCDNLAVLIDSLSLMVELGDYKFSEFKDL